MDGRRSDLKYIASIVRSIINTIKEPCLLRDVLAYYPEVENTPLPYRNLGYETPEDLLTETGEFTLERSSNGDTVITAKLNEKSAHIVALVRDQKTNKPLRILATKPMGLSNRCIGGDAKFKDRNSNSLGVIDENNGLSKVVYEKTLEMPSILVDSREAQLKHVTSIVRSIINSQKPPCFMRDVLKYYPEVEGMPLPYRSLGYETPEYFLMETGEFIFTSSNNGDTIITAKYNKSSAHIVTFVSEQKTNKSLRGGETGFRNINSPDHTNKRHQRSNMFRRKPYSRSLQSAKSIGVELSGYTHACPVHPQFVHRYVHYSRVNALGEVLRKVERFQDRNRLNLQKKHQCQDQRQDSVNPIYRWL
uniref:HTH OST-type domain-containing protein n=1 Tax=Glossina austeni TaxID=7395 RepID=A0A1A9V4V0_GLOAU